MSGALKFVKERFVKNPTFYVYNHSTPGPFHVEEMKRLAANGKDLAMYIRQNVRKIYSRGERPILRSRR